MRLAHIMIRVNDLEESINFYQNIFGMNLLKKMDNEAYRYTLAFMGYGNDINAITAIELTYNWGTTEYDLGSAFGHIAIGVDDIYTTCDAIKADGGNVTREPGPVKGGTTEIAFVKDPDGYMIELIQNRQAQAGIEG